MSDQTALPAVGDTLHGFRITAVDPVPDIRATAVQALHEASGAQLLHLLADDPENLFAIAFRTPPPDDTGLPHILEHTVLCGSRRYPVKDPFVEMLKTSMATFINAMTYPDKTVYPCASMNEKDFFHLARVYADAVFHPLISEMHFKQEGHHFDFATPGDTSTPLVIRGIVYNEMKGAYSDLDGVIHREETRRLCPDNAYGRDSGGDPHAIPSLTYNAFRDFHARYYHPSNARIFLYGDIPTERHLAFLHEEYLRDYTRIEIDTRIDAQPRWDAPRFETIPYPVDPGEETSEKTAITLTWLCGATTDAIRSLAMHVLDTYFLDNAASPLRKALIDSQLGAELTSSGFADHQFDTFFGVGLKGTEPDRRDALVQLVFDTLKNELTGGLDKEKLDAAFHQLEISAREIGSAYPLRLMDRVYRSWLYDADPTRLLRLHTHLQELHRQASENPRFFETILRETLLDNPHYTVLTFVPDPDLAQREADAFSTHMAETKTTLSPDALQDIAGDASALEAMQNAPNTPEALSTLPRLALSDVPPDPITPETETRDIHGRPLLSTNLFAGGLPYIDLAFDLTGLDADLWADVPVFAGMLTKMGADGADYLALAEEEASACGGISAHVECLGRVDDPSAVLPCLRIRTRGLENRLPKMLDILRKRILHADFTDRKRLRDVLRQGAVHLRSALIPEGNRYAATHATRTLHTNAYLASLFGGFPLLGHIEHLAAHAEAEADALVERLERIRTALLARDRVTGSLIASPEARGRIESWYGELLDAMPGTVPPASWPPLPPCPTDAEGIAAASDVSFVAAAFPAVTLQHPDAAALYMLSLHLSFGHLWNEVRAKRGAYGCRAGYNPLMGTLHLASYRDPCISETLATYDDAWEHLLGESWTPDAIANGVIGVMKTLDKPLRPKQVVGSVLSDHLCGVTDAVRRDFRRRLLALQEADIRRAVTDTILPNYKDARICILSSRRALESVPALPGGRVLSIRDAGDVTG